jgi:hypothetical protein
MGVGVLPLDVYHAIGRSLGLTAVTLDEEWAARSLVIVVRDADALSPVSRLLFDHLSSVEGLASRAALA